MSFIVALIAIDRILLELLRKKIYRSTVKSIQLNRLSQQSGLCLGGLMTIYAEPVDSIAYVYKYKPKTSLDSAAPKL